VQLADGIRDLAEQSYFIFKCARTDVSIAQADAGSIIPHDLKTFAKRLEKLAKWPM